MKERRKKNYIEICRHKKIVLVYACIHWMNWIGKGVPLRLDCPKAISKNLHENEEV